LLALVIVLQAGALGYGLFAQKLPKLWPLVLGDLVFSGVLLFVLWRMLGRLGAEALISFSSSLRRARISRQPALARRSVENASTVRLATAVP
jgi:hypothetical protein